MAEPAAFSGLLDPVVVAKLATMELRARTIVEGALAGRHRGARQGHSLEFAGHRAYSPGDEWRRIDWKVYAKTDRWVVREEQEETNLRAVVLLDRSRSMAFAGEAPGGGRVTKFRYASMLSAAFSYLLVHRGESVGLGLFSAGLDSFLPARGGAEQLSAVLDRLEHSPCEGETDFRASFEAAGLRLPRRSLVVLISDFLSSTDLLYSSARTLVSRKHEVVALQVLDAAERDFPYRGDFLFEDLETGRTIRLNAAEAGAAYRRRFAERLEKTARMFHSLGVDCRAFFTDTPLDRALSLFLERRRAGMAGSAV